MADEAKKEFVPMTVDKLQIYANMFVNILNMSKGILPPDSPVLHKWVDVVGVLAQTPWFQELMCFIINVVGEKEANQEEVVDAIKHFLEKNR